MSELTQNMQTHCVGRLLIDLPAGTTWKPQASSAQLGSLMLSVTTGVSEQQYRELVEKRWNEVQAIKSDNYGKAYLRPSERIATPEGGAIFAYEFEYVDGLADDDETVVQQLFHQAEGFFWRDGTLFKVTPSLNSKDTISKLFPRLHARATDEIPNRPGLCLSGAFVDGYYDLVHGEEEEVIWRLMLPLNQGLIVRHSKVWQPAESLFQRDKGSLGEAMAYMAATMGPGDMYKEHEFRRAERQVGELKGEEGVSGATEGESKSGYKTSIGGVWEFSGQVKPSPRPQVNVKLNTPEYSTSDIPTPGGGFPSLQNASNGPTEAQFFEVWDAIINSIRFRPEALTPPPAGGKPLNSPSGPSPVTSIHSGKPGTDDYALEEFLAGLSSPQDWMDKL
ncbi:hypothetical protein PchlR47_31355 [Pseudomonas chlororaphis]|nr:hypothetical protein PchlR47_31355 [Pseudomonas chlororaphis]